VGDPFFSLRSGGSYGSGIVSEPVNNGNNEAASEEDDVIRGEGGILLCR
jgi:hypothetical protein